MSETKLNALKFRSSAKLNSMKAGFSSTTTIVITSGELTAGS